MTFQSIQNMRENFKAERGMAMENLNGMIKKTTIIKTTKIHTLKAGMKEDGKKNCLMEKESQNFLIRAN